MTFTELKDAVRDYLEARLATVRAEWDFDLLSNAYLLRLYDCGRSRDVKFSVIWMRQMTEAELVHALNGLLCELVVFPMANGAKDNLWRQLDQARGERDMYREQEKARQVIEASYDAL